MARGPIKARDPRTGKVVEFRPRRSEQASRGFPPHPRRRFGRLRRIGRGGLLVLALAVVAIGLQFYPSLNAETLTGPVTHVRDGDTIEVSGVPIRLNGLNCAELGTALGSAGRAAVSRLVAGQSVTCTLTGERTYDRHVGRCWLPSGDDIAALLIRQGVCGRCARYDWLRRYADEQAEAGPYPGEVPGYCS